MKLVNDKDGFAKLGEVFVCLGLVIVDDKDRKKINGISTESYTDIESW